MHEGNNPREAIGGNNPPDPIDEALAPYGDTISEAENWLDGSPVEDEDQMKAVDKLIADMRKCGSDLAKAKKSATAPLHDAWKAEIARWKPTEDDVDRIKKGLAALADPFKRRLAAEKAEAERKAREEAEAKARAAWEAVQAAEVSDIDAQRAADQAKAEAEAAAKAAKVASKDQVKGLRTVTKYEIEDHRAALHWIAKNDRDAITSFVDDYVRRNHKVATIDGVRVWQDKEAY
jgi:hypothetical protein